MHLTARSRRRITAGLCLLMVLCVAAISLLFYSPLHKHDRNSGQVCSFSQFEHGGFEPPSAAIDLPALHMAWRGFCEEPAKLLCLYYSAQCAGRAPPSAIV
jgi:hypothetical protein